MNTTTTVHAGEGSGLDPIGRLREGGDEHHHDRPRWRRLRHRPSRLTREAEMEITTTVRAGAGSGIDPDG